MDSSHPELLDVSLNVGKKPKEYELYLLTFVFSKPMDAGSILQNLVVLDSNGKSLPLGSMSGDSYGGFLFFGTSDENPCIVYGFLADPLFYGEYTIRLGEETLDADGNPIGETMERSFTGGYVAPKILSVTPSLDFNERYSVIRVTFSSYMSYVFFLLNANQDGYLDPASVMLTAPDGSVARRAGHAVISDEIYDLYFDKQSLSGDYSFTVNSPYLDQNGNGIAGEEEDVFSSVFSVAATPDDSYPELLDVSLERVRKEGGEENINKLTLTFSKPMDPDSILENLYVFGPDGQSLEVGDSLECLLIDAENPCKVFGWFWKDLFYGEYTVRIGEETLDADGNPAGETMEYSFTGGFTAPKILSVTSSLFEEDGYKIITVRVTFSSFMTMSDMGNITLTGPDEYSWLVLMDNRISDEIIEYLCYDPVVPGVIASEGDFRFSFSSPYLDQNGNGIAGEAEDVFTTVVSVGLESLQPAAPVIAYSSSEATAGPVTITITAGENAVFSEYSINEGISWIPYAEGISLFENGSVWFRSYNAERDKVSEISMAEVTWIDHEAPDAPVIALSTDRLTDKAVTVSASFSRDAAVRQYSLDGGQTWQNYSAPFEVASNGVIHFRYEDALHNAATSTFEVTNIVSGYADIGVSEVRGPAEVVPGDTISISWKLMNSGTAPVEKCSVSVYAMNADNPAQRMKLGSVPIQYLSFGEEQSQSLTITWGQQTGYASNLFQVIADEEMLVDYERDRSNNTAVSEKAAGQKFHLSIKAAETVAENAGRLRLVVGRTGNTANALTVHLNSESNDIVFENNGEITFGIGQTELAVYAHILDNADVDGRRNAVITVFGDNCNEASSTVVIMDDEKPSLSFELKKTELTEGDSFEIFGVVKIDHVQQEDIRIRLTADKSQVTLSSDYVILKAGESQVDFGLTVIDDNISENTKTIKLSATADSVRSATQELSILDNDLPAVAIGIDKTVIKECDGSYAIVGTLYRTDDSVNYAKIRLVDQNNSGLILPSEVVLGTGAQSVNFYIGIKDNAIVDGKRTATVLGHIYLDSCGCTVTPSGGETTVSFTILDDDGAALGMSLSSSNVAEGKTDAAILTLTRNTTDNKAMTVNLSVKGTSLLNLPETVSFAEGKNSVSIMLSTGTDGVNSGNQLAMITATADGYADAVGYLNISDVNLPDFIVSKVQIADEKGYAGTPTEVRISLANNGFLDYDGSVSVNLTLSNGTNLGTYQVNGPFAIGESREFSVYVTLPEITGNYFITAQADPDNKIVELNDNNNISRSASFPIVLDYTITAQVEPEVLYDGKTITIAGQTLDMNGKNTGNKDVMILISGQYGKQTIATVSDAEGNYSVSCDVSRFNAGTYTVQAGYLNSYGSVQDSFDIAGIKVSSPYYQWDMYDQTTASGTFRLNNLSGAALNDVTIEVLDAPDNFDIEIAGGGTLAGNGSLNFNYTVKANGLTSNGNYSLYKGWQIITFRATSREGISTDFQGYFHSQEEILNGELTLSASGVTKTLYSGETTYCEYTVTNTGRGDTGTITVSLPDVPYLRLISAKMIDNLASGESVKITYAVDPTALGNDIALNAAYSGRIAVNAEHADGKRFDYSYTFVSNETGNVNITVSDDYTFYSEEKPMVSGVSVKVFNAYTNALVTSGITDSDGKVSFENLAEGKYLLKYSADRHESAQQIISVGAGETQDIDTFLNITTVSYTWEVQKIELTDTYEIVLSSTFEAHVPAPVLTLDGPSRISKMDYGETQLLTFTVTNHGLIAAQDFQLDLSDLGYDYYWKVLNHDPVTIPANSSKEFSVLVYRSRPWTSYLADITQSIAKESYYCMGYMSSDSFEIREYTPLQLGVSSAAEATLFYTGTDTSKADAPLVVVTPIMVHDTISVTYADSGLTRNYWSIVAEQIRTQFFARQSASADPMGAAASPEASGLYYAAPLISVAPSPGNDVAVVAGETGIISVNTDGTLSLTFNQDEVIAACRQAADKAFDAEHLASVVCSIDFDKNNPYSDFVVLTAEETGDRDYYLSEFVDSLSTINVSVDLRDYSTGAILTLDKDRHTSGIATTNIPEGYSDSVMFLANGGSGSNSATVYYEGWAQDELQNGEIKWITTPVFSNDTTPVDWDAILSGLDIDADAKTQLISNMQQNVGTTNGDLVAMMNSNARYLEKNGITGTDNAAMLLQFEILQQTGALCPVGQQMISSSDLSLDVTNGSLTIERTYSTDLISRYTKSSFGYGWTCNWDVSLSEKEGVMTFHTGTTSRMYSKNGDGSFINLLAADNSVLNATGSGYRITEANGIVYDFDQTGKLLRKTDTNGNSVSCSYSDGYLVQLTHSCGESFTFTRDENGNITRVTGSNGKSIDYTYSQGNLTSATNADSNYCNTYQYGEFHNITAQASTGSSPRIYTYDENGRLCGISSRDGAYQMTLSYGQNGEITIKDNQGTDAMFCYGATGTLLAVSDRSSGEKVSYTYDDAGRLLSMTDSDGKSMTMVYDAMGNMTGIKDGQGNVSTVSYGDGNVVETMTDVYGASTRYTYDSSFNVTGVQYADGTSEVYTYNPDGSIRTFTDVKGTISTYTYDDCGRVLSETFNGKTVSYTYDAGGNVTGITWSDDTTSSYEYNSMDLMTSFTDSNSNSILYAYDAAGRIASIRYADGSSETYTYNAAGDLTQWCNRRGETVSYTVDALGNTTRTTHEDGTVFDYRYDDQSRLVAAGDMSFTYNKQDYVTKVICSDNRAIHYTYNALDQVISISDELGHITNYSYTQQGDLDKLTNESGELVVDYDYDSFGRLSKVTRGNGTYSEYKYNSYGEVSAVNCYSGDGALTGYSRYTYNADDLIVSKETQDGVWSYSYDKTGQLLSSILKSGDGTVIRSESYTYDSSGNRLSSTVDGVTTTYTYNNLNQIVTSTVGGVTTNYRYDMDGNLLEDAERIYTWTTDNRVASETLKSTQQTWTYEYDALGNRISSTTNGVRTTYTVDLNGNVLAEYVNGIWTRGYYQGNMLAGWTSANGDYYFNYDLLGSATSVTSSNGTVVNRYSYDSFGNVISSTEGVANDFRFAGGYGLMQNDSGTVFVRARNYDPKTGRWISADPIGINGGENLYVYCGNNGVNSLDVDGCIVYGIYPSGIYVPIGSILINVGGKESRVSIFDMLGLPESNIDLYTPEVKRNSEDNIRKVEKTKNAGLQTENKNIFASYSEQQSPRKKNPNGLVERALQFAKENPRLAKTLIGLGLTAAAVIGIAINANSAELNETTESQNTLNNDSNGVDWGSILGFGLQFGGQLAAHHLLCAYGGPIGQFAALAWDIYDVGKYIVNPAAEFLIDKGIDLFYNTVCGAEAHGRYRWVCKDTKTGEIIKDVILDECTIVAKPGETLTPITEYTYTGSDSGQWGQAIRNWIGGLGAMGAYISTGASSPKAVRAPTTIQCSRYSASQMQIDFADGATGDFITVSAPDSPESVCAYVAMEFHQSAVTSREGFEGVLTLANNNDSAIENFRFTAMVLDADGVDVSDLFEIVYTDNTGFSTTVSGDETLLGLEGGCAGQITVVYVPGRNTALEGAENYQFTGTISYHDRQGGNISIDLNPVTLTVNPSPVLTLRYFMERDVYSDDPFTTEVEPAIPAEIAVLVVNNGLGDARNFSLSGFTPVIVENEKGLLLEYNMTEAALNGRKNDNGILDVNFGTISGKSSAVAQWRYTTNIQGHYLEQSVDFTQMDYSYVDQYGNKKYVAASNREDVSLIESAEIHELVRSVNCGDDDIPDFLVNDLDDADVMPDTLYLSTGGILDVNAVSGGIIEGAFGTTEATLTLTATLAEGWNYLRLADPGNGDYLLTSVIRNGEALNERNFWQTDRYFVDEEGVKYEDRLHFIDKAETAGEVTYTLTYTAKDSAPLAIEAIAGPESVVETAVDSLTVVFSKDVNAETFTWEDMTLYRQGELSRNLITDSVTVTRVDNRTFVIGNLSGVTGVDGYYQFTVHTVGISDTVGNAGLYGKAVSWTNASTASAIIALTGLDDRMSEKKDSVTVEFNAAIDPATFSAGLVSVNNKVVDGLKITAVDDTNTKFTISGFSGVLTEGRNLLSIDVTGISSVLGTKGVVPFTKSWIVDTQAPSIISETSVLGTTNEIPRQLTFTFNEDVTVGDNAFVLKRNGVAVPKTGGSINVKGNTVAVTDLPSDLTDGMYELILDLTRVQDATGNHGTGTVLRSWTMDRTAPSQIADLHLTADCDLGESSTDNRTSVKTITLAGTLPEAGLGVKVYQQTGSQKSLLYNAAANSTALQATFTVTGGNSDLVVELTDAAGNTSESILSIFVDDTIFSADYMESFTDSLENSPDSVTIIFSDAVFALKVSDFILTRDDIVVSLDNCMVSMVDDRTWRLSGITGTENGVYTLSLNLAGVNKLSTGLSGTGTEEISWSVRHDVPPSVISSSLQGNQMLDSLSLFSIVFSDDMNCGALISSGAITQAVKLQKVAADGMIVKTILLDADDFQYITETNTLLWHGTEALTEAGSYRIHLDHSLLQNAAGIALDGGTVSAKSMIDFEKSFTFDVAGTAYSVPVWNDYNNNGKQDLLVAEKSQEGTGKIRLYLNAGSQSAPLFDDYVYLQGVSGDWNINAVGCLGTAFRFADVNGDNVEDIVYGTSDGMILYALRNGDSYGTGTSLTAEGSAIDVGNRAVLDLFDWDGDGNLDILSGSMDGKVYLYVNKGNWTFAEAQILNIQLAEGWSAVAVADLNGDGVADLVSGDAKGNLYAFLNNGMNDFAQILLDTGSDLRSRPFVADVNGDGIADLTVGYADGSVKVFNGKQGGVSDFEFRINSNPVFREKPKVAVDGYTVTFSWKTSGEESVQKYRIKVGDMVYETISRTYTMTSVDPGTFSFQIGAWDASGWETWTSVDSFTVIDITNPEFSGMPAISQRKNSVTISWNAATDNVGVAGYKVEVNGEVVADIKNLSYSMTGLNLGNYRYRVAAYDAAGLETWSAEQSFSISSVADEKDHILASVMPTADYGYGCVAASVGMLIGYYDLYGYCGYDVSNLIKGSISAYARGNIDAPLNKFIFSDGYVSRFIGTTADEELNQTFVSGTSTLNTENWDSLADWLGTGQYWRGSADYATAYYFGTLDWVKNTTESYSVSGTAFPAKYADFKYGLAEYVKTAGYTIDSDLTKTVKTDTIQDGSFTFDDLALEIDAGRGVLLSLISSDGLSHMVVAYGYNDAKGEIIFDDTSKSDCRMAWNGSYSYAGHEYTIQSATTIVFDTTALEEFPHNELLSDLVGNENGVSWKSADPDAHYIVEISTDHFEHCIQVSLDSAAMDTFALPQGTFQWRVRPTGSSEWSVGSEILSVTDSSVPKQLVSDNDVVFDVFFANANGTWSTEYVARHVGFINGWKGTREKVNLSGKNRLSDIFAGSDDANILVLTDDPNGDSLFVDDIYTSLPSNVAEQQARLANIKAIYAGAGDDIVDMTSRRFVYDGNGVLIHGGDGNDTIWTVSGENILHGDAGNDRIIGGANNDVIAGGSGDDSLHGGGGDDIFTFGGEFGNDTVEQLADGKVTLWFGDLKSSDVQLLYNGNDTIVTAKTGTVTAKNMYLTSKNLLFGTADGYETQFESLSDKGAFAGFGSQRIWDVHPDTLPPSMPMIQAFIGDPSYNRMILTWIKSKDNEGAVKYEVRYSTSDDMSNAVVVTTETNTIDIGDLEENRIYYWQIRAVDNAGNPSAWSPIASYGESRSIIELDSLGDINISGEQSVGLFNYISPGTDVLSESRITLGGIDGNWIISGSGYVVGMEAEADMAGLSIDNVSGSCSLSSEGGKTVQGIIVNGSTLAEVTIDRITSSNLNLCSDGFVNGIESWGKGSNGGKASLEIDEFSGNASLTSVSDSVHVLRTLSSKTQNAKTVIDTLGGTVSVFAGESAYGIFTIATGSGNASINIDSVCGRFVNEADKNAVFMLSESEEGKSTVSIEEFSGTSENISAKGSSYAFYSWGKAEANLFIDEISGTVFSSGVDGVGLFATSKNTATICVEEISGTINSEGKDAFAIYAGSGSGSGNICGANTSLPMQITGLVLANATDNAYAITGNVDKYISIFGMVIAGAFDFIDGQLSQKGNGTAVFDGYQGYAEGSTTEPAMISAKSNDTIVVQSGGYVVGDISLGGGSNVLYVANGAYIYGDITGDTLDMHFVVGGAFAQLPMIDVISVGSLLDPTTTYSILCSNLQTGSYGLIRSQQTALDFSETKFGISYGNETVELFGDGTGFTFEDQTSISLVMDDNGMLNLNVEKAFAPQSLLTYAQNDSVLSDAVAMLSDYDLDKFASGILSSETKGILA